MISFLDVVFLHMAFTVLVGSFFINFFEKRLPKFVVQAFRYGKFAYQGTPIESVKSIEVPKSYFRHFYVISTITSTYALFVAIKLYFYKEAVPLWLIKFLDLLCGSNRQPVVSIATTLIVLTLMLIQCIRRFYETYFVQVFAKTSKINLSHYIIGHIHYFGCIAAILSRSVGFTHTESDQRPNVIDTQTLILAIPAICLFSFAWLNQFKSNIILANLRKDKNAKKVVSQKYFLPDGGLFKYVSSPHLLCEILIYISLTLLLFKNTTWLCILLWVISNQVETALLSHWWYQETFPKLPKDRKALLPHIL